MSLDVDSAITYNNQSLLATGCYEKIDSGVTNLVVR